MLALGQKQPFHTGEIVYSYNDRGQKYDPYEVENCRWDTKYNEFTVDLVGKRTSNRFPGISIKGILSKRELFTRKVDLISP